MDCEKESQNFSQEMKLEPKERDGRMGTVLGGGQALAELDAAREGTLVEPRIGVHRHSLPAELLHVDGRHDRLKLGEKPLDPHSQLLFDRSIGLSSLPTPIDRSFPFPSSPLSLVPLLLAS